MHESPAKIKQANVRVQRVLNPHKNNAKIMHLFDTEIDFEKRLDLGKMMNI